MGKDSEDTPDELFSGVETASDDFDGSGVQLTPEDRPRGILSPTDREYLCGRKEYAQPQTDANRRQEIRERIKNGLKDFVYLWAFLESDERQKVFKELGEEETDEAIESMVTFAFLGIDQNTTRMEECIERGVLAAANATKLFRSAGRATNADVSINVEYNSDDDKIYRRFEEGKQLTDAEVGLLLRSGRLDEEDIKELENGDTGFPGVFVGWDGGSD